MYLVFPLFALIAAQFRITEKNSKTASWLIHYIRYLVVLPHPTVITVQFLYIVT